MTLAVVASLDSMNYMQHMLRLERLQTDMMATQDTMKVTCVPGHTRCAGAHIGKVTN